MFSVCDECGSLVVNHWSFIDAHDKFHKDIAAISEKAGRYKSPPTYG